MSDPNLSSFIWSVADLLRGDYKQSEYGKVILPFTVLRRLDCVLESTKSAVLAELAKRTAAKVSHYRFRLDLMQTVALAAVVHFIILPSNLGSGFSQKSTIRQRSNKSPV